MLGAAVSLDAAQKPFLSTAAVGVMGAASNLKGSYGTTTTATWTADEIVVKTALGGFAYVLGNVNLTLNISTTGANGMDTGVPPASGDLFVYLIYNPSTDTSALLATTACNTAVYIGGHMPAGYTASILVGSLKTSASQFQKFAQFGRKTIIYDVHILQTSANNVWAALSLAAWLPANAKTCGGWAMGPQGQRVYLAADNQSLCTQLASGTGASFFGTSQWELPLVTPQTLWYQIPSGGSGNCDVALNSYTF